MRPTVAVALVLAAALLAGAPPAEAKKARAAAPLPAGIVEIEVGGAGQAPKAGQLTVAVLTYGKPATYDLQVSPFSPSRKPKSAPKADPDEAGVEMPMERDWAAELELARAAGELKRDPAKRRAMGAKKPAALKPGARDAFYVWNRANGTNGDVPVTLKLVSDKAAWWVADGVKYDAKELARVAKTFEEKSYKRVRRVFGKELKQGDAAAPRLHFVVSPLHASIGGYFSPTSLWPGQEDRAGYGRKTLFIATSYLGRPSLDGCIVHEFQHLVNFSEKCAKRDFRTSEASWVNEGFAVLSEDVMLNAKGTKKPKKTNRESRWLYAKWLRDTDAVPLETAVTDLQGDLRLAAYGRSYLFARYLADRFGEGIILDVVGAEGVGRAGIGEAVAPHGVTFDELWRDWAIANTTAAGLRFKDSRFAYKSVPFGTPALAGVRLVPEDSAKPVVSGRLPPYTVRYHTFRAATPQTWKVSLKSAEGGPLRAVAIAANPTKP